MFESELCIFLVVHTGTLYLYILTPLHKNRPIFTTRNNPIGQCGTILNRFCTLNCCVYVNVCMSIPKQKRDCLYKIKK